MRRIKIISTAICFAIVGAILPMGGTLFLAWFLAFQEESETLHEYATRMLIRAKYTLDETRKALSLLENNKNILPICSQKQIHLMREVSTLITEAKKISYFENDVEYCTSCGGSEPKIPRSRTHLILPDGLEVGMAMPGSTNSQSLYIPVRHGGNYDVFIDSKRLSDIITPAEVWLAIVYDGKIITEQNKIQPALLKIIMNKIRDDNLGQYYQQVNGKKRLKPADSLKKNQVFILDERMIFISQYGPFHFISSEPESFVDQHYKKLQLIFLPFGFITAFFIIGLVIFYSRKRLSFKADLQEALNNEEFFVCYHPIVNTASGICCGAEALVRWQRANGQMVSPDFFISYAEEAGIISAITKKVIDLVFDEMEQFLAQNKEAHIAINTSGEDIHNGCILEILEAKILKSKITRQQIWIELTERTFLKMHEAKKIIIQARALGYIVVIDDFGTGYSNLSYLQNLPLDVLKIDKSFIDSLGMHSATSHVAKHIIEIAKSVNLKIVAEGVEKQAQYNYLKERKVEYIQGYLFSKPLSAAEFIKFFDDNTEGSL
ncbi:regulatory protein (EAL domain) [Legionella santicrucis]|uniref:cyclic-guanylate-specific phosphodiesterase n=1 Tax=Legionella santicrucis TaxID=45074 RepID=A0A0W0YJ95_9GAMM|nr:EAL domain-containing protein [Legionella santicrucis]KTD57033.1 regulatory protein (EAL domain) [Legionella santicrucis]